MRINNVVGFTTGTNFGRNNVAFGRKLKKNEEKSYTEALNKAWDYLGVQNRALIIHGPSFPAGKDAKYDQEIGSPYGQKEFTDFARLHGFNSIQLGPGGKLNKGDNSPYTSSIFEKNVSQLNLGMLADTEFAGILTEAQLAKIAPAQKSTHKGFTKIDYQKGAEIADKGIAQARKNLLAKLAKGDKNAILLQQEYENFLAEKGQLLNQYAVLNVLSEKYGTDWHPNWDKADRDLIPAYQQGNKAAIKKFDAILKDNVEFVENYKFGQFLINKQAQLNKENSDVVYIDDLLVGQSPLDQLIHGEVFLKGYGIGCRGGGPFNSPQLWGIPLVDPDKLFNKDGSLGPSGLYLKEKLASALAGAKNIRIDHAMGLVNPYIYKTDSVEYLEKDGVWYPDKDKLQAGFLSEWKNVDKHNNYKQILPKIILPTMREMGVDPHQVVWENLGDYNQVFNEVFTQQEHLNGISGLLWITGKEARLKHHDNWAYIGCHDNPPARQMIHDPNNQKRETFKSEYLATALRCDPMRAQQRDELQRKIDTDDREMVKAKFADLMYSTNKIQMSFMDFFGLDERFNVPGTAGGENWTLRLDKDYEDKYYKDLQKEDFAVNMPEVLQMAVQAKFDENVSQNGVEYWEHLNKIQPLIDELGRWSDVLKE